MSAQDLTEKYYVRQNTTAQWEDIATKFAGVKILKIEGYNERGESTNIYSTQWVDNQEEDYYLAGKSVIRKNVDLTLTFICGTRYGATDTQLIHDSFINYVYGGAFYLASKYMGKQAKVVALQAYKPTTVKLHRGTNNSYIMGSITLHMLDAPSFFAI